VKLAGLSLSFGLAIGISVAAAATIWPRSLFEWLVNCINIWSIAFPTFSVGVAGILIFVIWLGWTSHMGNILLPSLILGIDVAGQIVKPLHEDLKESMESNFIRTARAKGLSPMRIVLYHALPNSMTVALALGGIILAGLVNGSITMEVLFGLPGMSSLALSSIQGRDYTVVQAVILYLALTVVVANFITDIFQRLLDPRLRRHS
jgi:peptide/nickel transport system permease protein